MSLCTVEGKPEEGTVEYFTRVSVSDDTVHTETFVHSARGNAVGSKCLRAEKTPVASPTKHHQLSPLETPRPHDLSGLSLELLGTPLTHTLMLTCSLTRLHVLQLLAPQTDGRSNPESDSSQCAQSPIHTQAHRTESLSPRKELGRNLVRR